MNSSEVKQSVGSIRRVRIFGAPVDSTTETIAVQAILDAAISREGHWTITANLDHIRRYRKDYIARKLLETADLVLADGMPIVWASKIARTPLPERVAGSDMIWSIGREASMQGASIFLLGGSYGAAAGAARVLQERNKNLKIAGVICPKMGFESNEREVGSILDEVVMAAPQVILVGLGFPKQDLLIEKLRARLPEAAFVGVGVSFSFVTGEVPRAPRWMHVVGLEWLHRLWREPRRLVRRYLIDGLPFALYLFASAVRYRLTSSHAQGSDWGWATQDCESA
jgi:N-acetylglucosaminyldiphosphoundecaprenol N-acetyl-beta-D-mannosaminyltransferase